MTPLQVVRSLVNSILEDDHSDVERHFQHLNSLSRSSLELAATGSVPKDHLKNASKPTLVSAALSKKFGTQRHKAWYKRKQGRLEAMKDWRTGDRVFHQSNGLGRIIDSHPDGHHEVKWDSNGKTSTHHHDEFQKPAEDTSQLYTKDLSKRINIGY